MTAHDAQPAWVPDLSKTRSALRPLNNRETMLRARALCATHPAPTSLQCTGQIFVGIFFDGTGNNEKLDYLDCINNLDKQKHSNVVRLYHTYPSDVTRGTAKYYRYYIPGVGTPFPEIGDSGGNLGTAMSWNGEPRLIWGLTRVFNAVSEYVSGELLMSQAEAGQIANALGGIGSLAMQRNHVFRAHWTTQLKAKVESRGKNRPRPEQINLSVFGFSRGAAEARAFVNWLYALCDFEDGAYKFAGIPLRVDFLGIFDTVASVGVAGAFTSGLLGVEGRQSWAADNMQVHPGVESCLHIVAAHETRATFPLDSVRVEGTYPPNVREYVYPGAHSDVGGGYSRAAQGKTDALARVPGFEMYCAALAAGVPFLSFKELKENIAQALAPVEVTLDSFKAYCTQAQVGRAPVEQMMHQHMGRYFTYRYQARHDPSNNSGSSTYLQRDFYRKSGEQKSVLRNTQQHFIAILAATAASLDGAMQKKTSFPSFVPQPFQSEEPHWYHMIGGAPALGYLLYRFGSALEARKDAENDGMNVGQWDKQASQVREKLVQWRRWLADQLLPDLTDETAPERDILHVVEMLSDVPLPKETVDFFDTYVHDSSAGLHKQGLNEFVLNGIGIAKFRRVYFGDRGDAMLHEEARRINQKRDESAAALRKQKRQWDLEATEYARTR